MIKTYGYIDNTQLSPHFNAQEFRCKCGRKHDFQIDDDLITKLEALFSKLNCSKIIVTSGFRCAAHDKAVKGIPRKARSQASTAMSIWTSATRISRPSSRVRG